MADFSSIYHVRCLTEQERRHFLPTDKPRGFRAAIMNEAVRNTEIKNRHIWDKTEGRCWYCGIHLIVPDPENHDDQQRWYWYTIDHATPRSRGGSHNENNLLPSCNMCNNDKNDMTVEEFRIYLALRANNINFYSRDQIKRLQSFQANILNGHTHTFWAEQQGEE